MINFTKKDLKNGMVVETREGNRYMVIGDRIMRDVGYIPLNLYTDDLREASNSQFDIMKVYDVQYHLNLNDNEYALWERPNDRDIAIGDVFLSDDGCKLFVYNIEEYPNGATYYETFEVFNIGNELQFVDGEYTEENIKDFTFIENKPIYVEALHALMRGLNNEQVQA